MRVARVAGFTGAVTLAVDTTGIARGVRATIANATVAANDTAARVVTITADTTSRRTSSVPDPRAPWSADLATTPASPHSTAEPAARTYPAVCAPRAGDTR